MLLLIEAVIQSDNYVFGSLGQLLHLLHNSQPIAGGPFFQSREADRILEPCVELLLSRSPHYVLPVVAWEQASGVQVGVYIGIRWVRADHGLYDGNVQRFPIHISRS